MLHGWRVEPSRDVATMSDRPGLNAFRSQSCDLYVPAGDVGFWQGAIRDRTNSSWDLVAERIEAREGLVVDLLLQRSPWRQRMITWFSYLPRRGWVASCRGQTLEHRRTEPERLLGSACARQAPRIVRRWGEPKHSAQRRPHERSGSYRTRVPRPRRLRCE